MPHQQTISPWRLVLLSALCAVVVDGGGGGAAPEPHYVTNYKCPSVGGFTKCCHEFSHPGLCFKVDETDDPPEDTCRNFCLLKAWKYIDKKEAEGASKRLVRLDSTSDSMTTCAPQYCNKTNLSDHRRLGGSSDHEFCPPKYLAKVEKKCTEPKYLKEYLIEKGHFNETYLKKFLKVAKEAGYKNDADPASHPETYCAFFDYNPATKACCIPGYSEPIIPSFNRYTIDVLNNKTVDDLREALGIPEDPKSRRRLGGGGGPQDWFKAVKTGNVEVYKDNVCTQPDPAGLFRMAGKLEHLIVFAMMMVIIVFTIFCEQSLAASRRWVSYFNPLLHPCVDKVSAELMILGATAFLILIINESIDGTNSLGLPDVWYATLHWVDTVIFVFAIIYVMAAVHMINILCGRLTRWLARIDAQPIEHILNSLTKEKRGSLQAAIHAEKDKHHAPPELVANIKRILKEHKDSCDPADEKAPLTLPLAVWEAIARSSGDSSQEYVESSIKHFLTSEDTELILKLPTNQRRHLYLLMQALVELEVAVCKKMGGNNKTKQKMSVQKNPVELWQLSGRPSSSISDSRYKESQKLQGPPSRWDVFAKTKHIQYLLIKEEFLSKFFDTHVDLDFVFYIEVAMTFGITESFNIGPVEWFALLFACLWVIAEIRPLREHEMFTICCLTLLGMCIFVTHTLWYAFLAKIRQRYNMKNSSDLKELGEVLKGIHTERKKSEERSRAESSLDPGAQKMKERMAADDATDHLVANMKSDHHSLRRNKSGSEAAKAAAKGAASGAYNAASGAFHLLHNAHFSPPKLHRRNQKPPAKPVEQKVTLAGFPVTEYSLRKFVQIQLLVQCFYVAVFLVTYLMPLTEGTTRTRDAGIFSNAWVFFAMGSLALNILVVMPLLMFLGFSLASLINPDRKSLQEIVKLKKAGAEGLDTLKILVVDDLLQLQKENGTDNPEREYNRLFTKWAGQSYPGDHITNADIRNLLLNWMHENGFENFEMSRPKLMAMMRLVDDDRSGSIGFREFRRFATVCIDEHNKIKEAEAKEANEARTSLPPVADEDPGTAINPMTSHHRAAI